MVAASPAPAPAETWPPSPPASTTQQRGYFSEMLQYGLSREDVTSSTLLETEEPKPVLSEEELVKRLPDVDAHGKLPVDAHGVPALAKYGELVQKFDFAAVQSAEDKEALADVGEFLQEESWGVSGWDDFASLSGKRAGRKDFEEGGLSERTKRLLLQLKADQAAVEGRRGRS